MLRATLERGTGLISFPLTAALSGEGSMSATAVKKAPVAVPLAGAGALSATAVKKAPVAAALSGEGALTATATPRTAVTAALSGEGTLSATAVPAAPPGGFTPTDLTDLGVWLDASQLTQADGVSVGSAWTDLSGNGHHGTVVNSPEPVVKTGVLNGKRVVQFAANEGMIRGDTGLPGTHADADFNYSIFYVGRMIDTAFGHSSARLFAAQFPENNFLVGYWAVTEDTAYCGTFVGPAPFITEWPSPWRIWGATGHHDGTTYTFNLYKDGVLSGSTTEGGQALGSRYALSGYDATGTAETSDAQIAEVIIYTRKLSDSERGQVEDYLNEKWFGTPPGPSQLTGVTYSQSTTFDWLTPADYANMNDSNTTDAAVTGTDGGDEWLIADLGSVKSIDHIIIGADYEQRVYGDGNPWTGGYGALYASFRPVDVSTDGSTWTYIGDTPDYTSVGAVDGLNEFAIGTSARYVRISSPGGWLCITEFQIWGS